MIVQFHKNLFGGISVVVSLSSSWVLLSRILQIWYFRTFYIYFNEQAIWSKQISSQTYSCSLQEKPCFIWSQLVLHEKWFHMISMRWACLNSLDVHVLQGRDRQMHNSDRRLNKPGPQGSSFDLESTTMASEISNSLQLNLSFTNTLHQLALVCFQCLIF